LTREALGRHNSFAVAQAGILIFRSIDGCNRKETQASEENETPRRLAAVRSAADGRASAMTSQVA
jgi:hypothetical protein